MRNEEITKIKKGKHSISLGTIKVGRTYGRWLASDNCKEMDRLIVVAQDARSISTCRIFLLKLRHTICVLIAFIIVISFFKM